MDRIPAIRRAILAERAPLAAMGWSAVALAVPTAVRWSIDPWLSGTPFTTFYPAVLLTALLLGWRWALGVAAIAGVLANWLFLGQPGLLEYDVDDVLREVLFALSSAVLIATGEMCRRLVRELEASKARETLLNDELMHRVKNMFATVNALATLTARHSSPEEFQKALSGRMRALSRATDLLGIDHKGHCDIHRLVENAVEAFRTSANFTLSGPGCEVPRDACVPLSLALHELCTNAAKYGALSTPAGRVTVRWTVGEDEEGLLRLLWREEGGPAVTPPTRAGMGTQLLRRQGALSKVELDYRAEGVQCEICIEGTVPADAGPARAAA